MTKNCCLAGILFLFLHLRALAGDDPQVKHLGIEQGLSNNAVTCIYQDAKGFLWFGTYDGLNRYDGYGFTVYRNIIGDGSSIPFNNVASISADQHDNIWVSGLKGIAILDPLTGKFSVPAYRSCDGHGIVSVRSFVHMVRAIGGRYVLAASHTDGLLLFDGGSATGWQIPLKELHGDQGSYDAFAVEYDKFSNRVWVIIQGKGLYAFDPAAKTLTAVNTTIRNGYSLKVDNNGTLWMGTDNGLFALSKDRRSFSANYLPRKSRVVCIDLNSRNDLCFGTDGDGVWCLHANAQKAVPMLSATGAPLVNSNAVYSVYEDREGRKWIGTLRGGINVVDPKRSAFRTVFYGERGSGNIINNFILSFCEDTGRNVWIGTDGAGLRYWNRKTNTFRNYMNDPADKGSISDNFITGILRDDSNRIWVSTWFGGVNRLDRSTGRFEHFACYNSETNAEEKHIWMILEDHDHRIWASATNEGSLYTFDRAKDRFELFDNRIQNLQALTEDREGILWGGNYQSLIRIDKEHRNHRTYPIGYTVRCLHEDSRGQFWVGTQEGGLLLFDRKTGSFKQYTTADGLPGNTILRILEDNHGNLWMSTYNGISEWQRPADKFRNFSPSDGLQSTQFSFNAGLALSSGELLFGGIKGFNIFFPDSILQAQKTPAVYLTQVRIRNQPIRGDSRYVTDTAAGEIAAIRVPFSQATLSLDFTALEYDGADKINYSYYLAGWDKGWNYSNGSRTANYSSLREGDYIFWIRLSHADGTWSKRKELLHIIILPPWYRTWWAYLTYLIVCGGIVLLWLNYSRSKIRMRYEVRLAHMETQKEKELIERKLAFFTHITHEFRNPLTLIINPAKELMKQRADDPGMESVPFIYRNAQRLLSLVDQLLLFRKAETGSDVLKPVQVNIVALCHEVFLCFVDCGRAKKINYRFETATEEILLYVDKEKVEIALYNLLSNAFKYTPEKGEIVLQLLEEADSVEIGIKDTGIGIPEEVGDQVFDKFYQIKRSEMTSISGFGIGLYLVRQFVEAHKGEVHFHSVKGEGTCFYTRFRKGVDHLAGLVAGDAGAGLSPLTREIADEKAPAKDQEGSASLKGGGTPAQPLVSARRSILVVDDDPQLLDYVCHIFDGQYIIYKAQNGQEGLELARQYRPDLILSDLHMDGISGIELCETVKNDPELGQTPVILLTASSSANYKLEGVKHGADDYLTKPFDKDLLVARVAALLDSRGRVERSIYHTIVHGSDNRRLTPEDKRFLERIIAVVENHLDDEDFNIRKLASEVGMSHSKIYQKLKDLSGQSLNGFIRHYRLKKAAELFINTNYNVNEVAQIVGIGDGRYFREQFNKLFGLNPSEYIKKYRRIFSAKYQFDKNVNLPPIS